MPALTETETPVHPAGFLARAEDGIVGPTSSASTTSTYSKKVVKKSSAEHPGTPATDSSLLHGSPPIKGSRSWVLQRATWDEVSILARAIINTFGSIGFWVGCLMWVIHLDPIGNIVFASANMFFIATGIWWAMAAHKNFKNRYGVNSVESPDVIRAMKSLTTFEIMGASCQVGGAVCFNCGCLTAFWGEAWLPETYTFWAVGSGLFLLQGIFGQIMTNSFWGPLLPFWPKYVGMRGRGALENKRCCTRAICWHRCIPAAFLNSLGSFLFVLGSLSLCYEPVAIAGGWLYLFGSKCFIFANGGDTLAFLDQLALKYFRRKLILQKNSGF